MADWSLLPKDLLELIIGCSESCFEIVHFRSVCISWRSAIPPPSYRHGLGVNSLLPVFNHAPRFEGSDTHCILKKIPVFLFRFQTPFGTDNLLFGVSERESGEQKLLSPLHGRSWTYEDVTTLNFLSSQVIPLGYYYKINFNAITTRRSRTRRKSYSIRVAFLPFDGEDFSIVAGVLGDLMMYRSCDKRWTKIEGRFSACQDMVSFKGKFYVVDMSGLGRVFVIEPSLEVREIYSITRSHESSEEKLVVSGDELLLVQRFTSTAYGNDNEYKHSWFILFRLVEGGHRRWVRVIDLEDRVVFLGVYWNLCYSVKELPGMKGNCVVFNDPKYAYERIFVFDLRTMKTSNAFTECRGYMGAFGENHESLLSCGVVTHQMASMTH